MASEESKTMQDVLNLASLFPQDEEFLNFDLDEKRKRLRLLYHAAHCRHEQVGDCPKQRYCCAAKRVFQHMMTCQRTKDCDIPGCKKCRLIWKHYRKCQDRSCVLCSAVPTKYTPGKLCPQFKKNHHYNNPSSYGAFSSTCAFVGSDESASVTTSTSAGSMIALPGNEAQKQGEEKTTTMESPSYTPSSSSHTIRGEKENNDTILSSPPPSNNNSKNHRRTSSLPQQALDERSAASSNTRPPLSPRTPVWALY